MTPAALSYSLLPFYLLKKFFYWRTVGLQRRSGVQQREQLCIYVCAAAAAAAKSLQSCPTLCDPIDGSHQAPPSLGFSRQEHWSGLPFPSPMHESEK